MSVTLHKILVFFNKNRLKTVLITLAMVWFGISMMVFMVESVSPNEKANIKSLPEALWWGVVTFLTVGYGDYYPVTVEGRLLGSALMFSGVVAIAIITAKISSEFLKEVLLEGRGIVDSKKLVNHFVVCGYQDNMADLLLHILQADPEVSADKMVIVAHISPETIQILKSVPELKDVQVVIGDSFQQMTLEKARPGKAKKVLIVADRTPSPSGAIPSDAEADARTIMTAISLTNIARGVLITAEILDPKLDHYLKMAGVSDIIYSREYSRLLLGNAASGAGVANIIYDLLDPKIGADITTPAIEDHYVERRYSEFKSSFEKANPNSMVIGLLENSGNPHRIRELALAKAQKTADVGLLIENLKSVKTIRCNHPIFNPKADHIIPVGSAAIVMTTLDQSNEGQGRDHANQRFKVSA